MGRLIPGEKLSIFNNNILSILNKYAPIKHKQIKHKQYTSWLTENIKLMIKMWDKAHRIYVKSKTPQNLDYYLQAIEGLYKRRNKKIKRSIF